MPDLILDTSRDTYLIALFDETGAIDVLTLPHDNNLSASFLPSILDLLSKNNLFIKNISNLFVGVGPGSYTGTRIAVSIATGLSISLSCPLYPFCSLLPFLPKDLQNGPFSICLETKHAHFLLEGSLEGGIIAKSPKGRIIAPKEPNSSLKPQKEPNLPTFLPFLSNLKKQPPHPVKVIYLHNF